MLSKHPGEGQTLGLSPALAGTAGSSDYADSCWDGKGREWRVRQLRSSVQRRTVEERTTSILLSLCPWQETSPGPGGVSWAGPSLRDQEVSAVCRSQGTPGTFQGTVPR